MKEGGDRSYDEDEGSQKYGDQFDGIGNTEFPNESRVDQDFDGENEGLIRRDNDDEVDKEQLQETEDQKNSVLFERAGLSTLFLTVVDKLRYLYACDDVPNQIAIYSKILILKLLNLCMETNMAAGQYCTCQRILETLEMTFQDIYFDEDERDFIDFRNLLIEMGTVLEEDKNKNNGVTLNYGTLVARQMRKGDKRLALDIQCPQCQSELPFGIAQEKCFDCMAQLTVCQHTVSQLFDEEAFVVQCIKCRGKFQRSFA